MRHFHFTSLHHLYGIRRYGLTVGDVPTDLRSGKGRIGVWLTSKSEPQGHGLEGGPADKSRFRLTVDAPENALLVRWVDWASKNATPETVRVLHEVADAFETWWVYFGVIDQAAIEECVDMQTGAAVEDWGRTSSGLDAKPVPPSRRHAWHKTLIRGVKKATRRPTAGDPAADEFLRRLTEATMEYAAALKSLPEDERPAFTRRVVGQATLVFGVFELPGGWGHHLIKGQHELDRIVTTGAADTLKVTAIKCADFDEAKRIEQELGDGRLKTN